MPAVPVDSAGLGGLGVLLPVVGGHPQAGTSGVALALADAAAAAGLRVLLIDSADPARSGLAGVCAVEGRSVVVDEERVPIRLARRNLPRGVVEVRRLVGTGMPLSTAQIPSPQMLAQAAPNGFDLTVIDVGWDVWPLMAPGGRLGPLTWCWRETTPAALLPVLVLRPTAASATLAEAMLSRYAIGVQRLGLAGLGATVAVGADRWPQPARAAMGFYLNQMADRTLFVPASADAAVSGWGTAPAPTASMRAAAELLHRVGGKFAEAVGPPDTRRRKRRRG